MTNETVQMTRDIGYALPDMASVYAQAGAAFQGMPHASPIDFAATRRYIRPYDTIAAL